MRCDVCGVLVIGRYIRNFWGDVYCAHHREDHAICYACDRPISQRLTSGGSQYEDGRAICNGCRAMAVDRSQVAVPIVHQVQSRLAQYGLDTRYFDVPLQLVSVDWMTQGGVGIASARVQGLAQTTIFSKNSVETERRIESISVLWGLPREMFEGVVAHELGHVWLFKQHMNDVSDDLKEGLCNLFAYLLHREKDTPEARYSVHLLEENSDLVYGEGFRRARSIVERKGLRWLLHFVRRKRQWPH